MIGNIKSKDIAEKQLKNNGFTKLSLTVQKETISNPLYWFKSTDLADTYSVAQIFEYEDGSCSLFISHLSENY